MDEQRRGRILDDLKGFVRGEIFFDDITRALYSTDASILEVKPIGVVAPRDEEDVQALVRYAGENRVPLVARGAGTGVAGEALGKGLILDLSRHFRDIVEVGSDWVRVQPGVTCHQVNARLALERRRFAPDPASEKVCTIGGMLANNASGAHALRFGYTRDHVLAVRAILDSSDAVKLGKEPLQAPGDNRPGHLQDIINALAFLLEENSELIRTRRPRTPFNRCGYLLENVLCDSHLDMPRLLVGSEGTLSLFTEATLRTIPLPGGRAMVLLGFASLEAALRGVERTLPTGPSACELIDRRLLSLAKGNEAAQVAALVPMAAEAVLLVEYEADTPRDARAAADRLADLLAHADKQAIHVSAAFEDAAIDRLWSLREMALPSLYALKGGAQPVPFIEDVGVPVDALGEYLHRVQDILQEYEATASYLVHAGVGQVHTRPFLDLQRAEDVSKLTVIADKVHTLALSLGGTVSAQHATGLVRTQWVARQYGPLYAVFRQLKSIFDPRGIFNPGKIVDPDPRQATWPLRTFPGPDKQGARWQLHWEPGAVGKESAHCNGCGQCRLDVPGQRMCPIFHASHAEEATPRAKANLLRALLQEETDSRLLAPEEVRAVADLCVNCKMCAHECPAHVNIPKLMLEAKAANVAEFGMHRSDWFFARAEGFVRWGSRLAPAANFILASQTARWLLQKFFGLAGQLRLPRFAYRHFLRLAKRRGWTRKPTSSRPKVAYFADVFATYNEPMLGEAVVAVLQHQGFDVHVPAGQWGSGAAALTYGDVESAREIAGKNVRVLAELAREGYTIVCSEPTAALMLRQDYLDLLDDPDSRLVAEHTVELAAFLMDLHQRGRLQTDFLKLDLSLGHHVPCHVKALGSVASPDLLSLIPGVRIQKIDVSCSGMAGTFGMRAANVETALAAGRPMLSEMGRAGIRFGSTECSTCRIQMENVTGKRTMHPVQYLALAYGLLPKVAGRLQEPRLDLVL